MSNLSIKDVPEAWEKPSRRLRLAVKRLNSRRSRYKNGLLAATEDRRYDDGANTWHNPPDPEGTLDVDLEHRHSETGREADLQRVRLVSGRRQAARNHRRMPLQERRSESSSSGHFPAHSVWFGGRCWCPRWVDTHRSPSGRWSSQMANGGCKPTEDSHSHQPNSFRLIYCAVRPSLIRPVGPRRQLNMPTLILSHRAGACGWAFNTRNQ